MRINITVTDMTPAQWEWLLNNTEQWARHHGRPMSHEDTQLRACVIFHSPDPSLVETLHREIRVRTWLGLMEHLKTITGTAEALLTPDVLPDIAPYPPEVGRA